MCFDKSARYTLSNMERSDTSTRIAAFRTHLIKQLYAGGRLQITWEELYRTIKGYKIHASKTIIWNLFLDDQRLAKTIFEENNRGETRESVSFVKEDVTFERASFLYNMERSSRKCEKRVHGWKYKYVQKMITDKVLQVSGCNCIMSTIIVIFSVLLFYAAIFPMGEGIFDTSELSKAVIGFYAFGIVWYFITLLGEKWYPKTYVGLFVDIIFMAVSLTCCVLFSYVLTPAYYKSSGCFECPACPDTDDKLCFEYSKFHEGIIHHYAEANTCFCALDERLRRNEPIIPYGETEDYCGGDDCTCETILSNSPENWNVSQEYFNCVYYSPSGTPLFFFFGGFVILATSIVVIVSICSYIQSFLCFLFLISWKCCCPKSFRTKKVVERLENEL